MCAVVHVMLCCVVTVTADTPSCCAIAQDESQLAAMRRRLPSIKADAEQLRADVSGGIGAHIHVWLP